jgi:predicted Ser/Thr protein kinase
MKELNAETMSQEGAERLLYAIAEKAAEDYKKNLNIIHKTQSEFYKNNAKSDNDMIRRFLGDRFCGAIENEFMKGKKK